MSGPWPHDVAERRALRQASRSKLIRQAELQAVRYGLSIRCGGQGDAAAHADEPDGCRNDGSGCLCPCHDPDGA